MIKNLSRVKMLLLCGALSFPLASCVATYGPPGPRSNYAWVPEYRTYDGAVIYGHWKYVGPAYSDREWIPGHYDRYGKWQKPRWYRIPPSHKGGVWVPGHYGPRGIWIQGHWRY
ncbi:MAG: DUF3300 domain-containing protein [Chlorobi bacterium]|nr:DUF3300 domain-containing protein [Chlorobiota bacterium]